MLPYLLESEAKFLWNWPVFSLPQVSSHVTSHGWSWFSSYFSLHLTSEKQGLFCSSLVPKFRHIIDTQEMPTSVVLTTTVRKALRQTSENVFWLRQVTCMPTWDTHTAGCGSQQPRFLDCSLPLANLRNLSGNGMSKKLKRKSRNLSQSAS